MQKNFIEKLLLGGERMIFLACVILTVVGRIILEWLVGSFRDISWTFFDLIVRPRIRLIL